MEAGRVPRQGLTPPSWRASDDERRELLRLDDTVLLECRPEGKAATPDASGGEPGAEDAVTAFIGRPSTELLSRVRDGTAESVLAPWLMKLDWALEVVLKALVRIAPEAVHLPSLCEVNLSGSGIRFQSSRSYRAGDRLDLRFVLPPFVPIQAKGEVVRSEPVRGDAGRHDVAVRFTGIGADDRERIIRHIVQRQAERLRARRNAER